MTLEWYLQMFGLLFFIALLNHYTPKLLGTIGERRVAKILSTLPENDYRVINNVMLQTKRGLTQIDHIVISLYGIFVIETKNYKGWITGNDYSDQWVKNMYGKKYRFQNPLKQNFGHISALKELLGLIDEQLISMVVFTENANLKVKTKQHVINTRNLKNTISSFQRQIIDRIDLTQIETKIMELNVDSKENRKEHVNAIHKNLNVVKEIIKSGACPKCNGELVTRNGKYGEFTGCSNYPKCRYIVKK